MLQAIRSAEKSITYQQYFFEDGAIAHEIAEAFAERCRAGVEVKILVDSLGGGNIPQDIPDLWKQSGCQLGVVRAHQDIPICHPVGAFKL